MLPVNSFKTIGLLFQEKKRKIDFQDGGHGDHLGFPIRIIFAIHHYKSPRCFLLSFKSIGLSFQEKKRKIDFQDGGHLGLQIRTILTIFALQDTRYFPSNQLAFQFRRSELDFQDSSHGSHLEFLIGTILAIFDLQVTLINWPFCSEEEAKE